MSKIKVPASWIMAGLIVVSSLFITFNIYSINVSGNQEKRAFEELQNSAKAQAEHLAYMLEFQYAPLETAALCLEMKNGMSVEEKKALLEDFVKINQVCMMGYADINGDAVSYTGENLGNISERLYFTDIVYEGKTRAIDYIENEAVSDEPCVVFAVPVLKDGKAMGILFTMKERHFFEEALLDDTFDGKEMSFITNANGDIIVANKAAYRHIPDKNLFESHDAEFVEGISRENILDDLKHERAGSFRCIHDNEEFVAYSPFGINNCSLFCMIDKDSVTQKYMGNSNIFKNAIYRISAIFLLAVFYIVFITTRHTKQLKREQEQTRFQIERSNILFDELKSVVYDYNMKTGEFSVSDSFEKIMGFSLEKDLIDYKIMLFDSKYDYKAFLDAVAYVKKTGKSTFMENLLPDTENNVKWIKVSINPFFSDKNELTNIYGVISDVTDIHTALDEYDKMLSHAQGGGIYRCRLGETVQLEYASEGLFRMLGYSKAEFDNDIGQSYINAVYVEDRPAFRNFIKDVSKNNGIKNCRYRMVCRNGNFIHVLDTMEPIKNEAGELMGYASVTDITEFVEQQRYLEEKADTDEHTMLPNKSCCERILQDEKIIEEPTCCVMFDLNGLKQVNDSRGHIIGDDMIKEFANILRNNIREGDFVGRFGGDEFIAILYNTDEKAVHSFLNRINIETVRFNADQNAYSISFSAGYAATTGSEEMTFKDLLDKADANMYETKKKYKESIRKV